MRISDWSSDVCSSDLHGRIRQQGRSIADEGGKYVRAIGQTPGNQSLARKVCQGRTKFSLRPADAGYAVATAAADPLDSQPDSLSACLWHMKALRSEEHTYELQSLMRKSYAVYCWK